MVHKKTLIVVSWERIHTHPKFNSRWREIGIENTQVKDMMSDVIEKKGS